MAVPMKQRVLLSRCVPVRVRMHGAIVVPVNMDVDAVAAHSHEHPGAEHDEHETDGPIEPWPIRDGEPEAEGEPSYQEQRGHVTDAPGHSAKDRRHPAAG